MYELSQHLYVSLVSKPRERDTGNWLVHGEKESLDCTGMSLAIAMEMFPKKVSTETYGIRAVE